MKKTLALLLIFALVLSLGSSAFAAVPSLFGSSAAEEEEAGPQLGFRATDNGGIGISGVTATPVPSEGAPTWAIYIYMCGSDLESYQSSATDNLEQIRKTYSRLPDNVKYVIEAGGTTEWQNMYLDENYLNILTMSNKGTNILGTAELTNMSDPDTLEAFLTYALQAHPADRTMLIVWDHGGGIVNGACADENYDTNCMPVIGMRDAIASALKTAGRDKLDIMSYDCCLMATAEVAEIMSDIADYLLASEETIPGYGYDYATLTNRFIENPAITPEELGKFVCNDYYNYYTEMNPEGGVTLSFTDLSKISAVTAATEEFGNELLKNLYANPDYFTDVAVAAGATENYGSNNRTTGFYDLLDLGNFAENMAYSCPSAEKLIAAIDDCVIARIGGEYKNDNHGLSVYYSYDTDAYALDVYKDIAEKEGVCRSLATLYDIAINGSVTDSEKQLLSSLGLDPDKLPQVKSFLNVEVPSQEPELSEEGYYCVDFDEDVAVCTIDFMMNLVYYDVENNIYYYLGTNDEMDVDFDEGYAEEQFSGGWIMVGDWVANAELAQDMEDRNIYIVPFEYDGDILYAQIVYDRVNDKWSDIGFMGEGIAPGTMTSIMLEEGTELGVVQYVMDEDNNMELIEVDTIEYSHDMFRFASLPDGLYLSQFKIEDVFNQIAFSDFMAFEINGGKVIRG